MADLVVPDAISPLVGHRFWNVAKIGRSWFLTSMNWSSCVWQDPAMSASCMMEDFPDIEQLFFPERKLPHRHGAPEIGCRCGIYGAATITDLEAEVPILFADRVPARCVAYGTIEQWGRVVVGDFGQRSEFARVRTLVLCEGTFFPRPSVFEVADQLDIRYGVKVGISNDYLPRHVWDPTKVWADAT
jgi:hypothetical protein